LVLFALKRKANAGIPQLKSDDGSYQKLLTDLLIPGFVTYPMEKYSDHLTFLISLDGDLNAENFENKMLKK
jgi:hypothetical protein